MAVYFADPTYQRQGVVGGFVLSAPDYSGTPPGVGNSVSFTYNVANITVLGQTIDIATGYQHWLNIGGAEFSYTQQNSDTASTVATYLANAINSAADPLVTAVASGGTVTLSPRENTGTPIECTASVSTGSSLPQTLFELTGNELVPAISKGVLFAQATLYNPTVAPTLPAAPASQHSWLFYSSSSGWYWKNSATPTNATDACVGWVVTNATSVIAISSRRLGSGPEVSIVPAGPSALLLGSAGEDTGVPPLPNFTAAETNAQLVIGDLTLASATNAEEIAFAEFLLYYVNEAAGTTLTLAAALSSGAGTATLSGLVFDPTAGSVTFTFSNTTVGSVTIGPGYVHSIGIGAATYEYEQQTEDTAAIIAAELANIVNASADPNAYATASGATVVLTPLQNTGASVSCTASDANTPQTLTETEPTYVVIDQEIIALTSSGTTVNISRAQLGSTAAAHSIGAKVWPVSQQTMVFGLPLFSYGTPNWPTVVGQIPFVGQALVAASCWVSNEIGPSPIRTKCFTGQGPYAVDAEGNPLAPDVGGFTAGVTLNVVMGGLPYYQFTGTITVGPAPGSTPEIDVVMTNTSTGVTAVVARLMGPFTAGAVLSWASVFTPQPVSGATLVFQPTVTPLNIDGAPTVSSYTVGTLSVPNAIAGTWQPPEAPHSVVLTEAGPRTLNTQTQQTTTTLQVVVEETITPASGTTLGTMLHAQISFDGGTTYADVAGTGGGIYQSDRVDEDGTSTYYVTTIKIANVPVLASSQSIKARVWSLNQYIDNGVAGAVASSALTLTAIGAPSSTGATLSISGVTNLTDPTVGYQTWEVAVSIQTPGAADPSCSYYQATVFQCNSSGAAGPSGDRRATEHPVGGTIPNDGQLYTFYLDGTFVASGVTYDFSSFQVYGVSATATATPAWKDTTYSVLQEWPGGATNYILNYGAIPTGAIPGGRVTGAVALATSATTANSVPITGVPYGPMFQNLSSQLALNSTIYFNSTAQVFCAGPSTAPGQFLEFGAPGIVMGDNYTTPLNTVTINSTGATVASINSGTPAWASGTSYGANSLVSRNGLQFVSLQGGNLGKDPALYGSTSAGWWLPSSCVMITSTGVAIYGQYGSSIVASGSTFAITNATFSLVANGITTTINNNTSGGSGRAAGISVTDGTFYGQIDRLGLYAYNGSGNSVSAGTTTSGGYVGGSGNSGCEFGMDAGNALYGGRVYLNNQVVVSAAPAGSAVTTVTVTNTYTGGNTSDDGTHSHFQQVVNASVAGTWSGPVSNYYQTGLTANVPATYLYTQTGGTLPAGVYQVLYYMTGSTTGGGILQLLLSWVDERGTTTTQTCLGLSSGGAGGGITIRLDGSHNPEIYTSLTSGGISVFDLMVVFVKVM